MSRLSAGRGTELLQNSRGLCDDTPFGDDRDFIEHTHCYEHFEYPWIGWIKNPSIRAISTEAQSRKAHQALRLFFQGRLCEVHQFDFHQFEGYLNIFQTFTATSPLHIQH